MRSVVELGASVPAFLGKLWKLVNDSETNHLISWSPGSKTFVIKNQAEFAKELLPLYYKHNNMASFIRQLNMYGFHKITSVENGGLRYEKDEIEFSHPCFMRGHAYLLEHIKRKIANPKSIVASNESGEKILLKPEIMNKVLADVKQMKGKQESLDAKFSAMKQENEALWREVAILRQKHIKQQQIVNNLIQFLMSLVQPTRAPNASGNVGVKRPYQLMINSAAHNFTSDTAYPDRIKNIKLDKDIILDDLNEENVEDGPTIHELAHDDILPNETSQDSMDRAAFVSVDLCNSPTISNVPTITDPTISQYHVTMEDGEDVETDRTGVTFPNMNTNRFLRIPDTPPTVTSPSPISAPSRPGQSTMEHAINNVIESPSTSRSKTRNSSKNMANTKGLLSSNFNAINSPADFKLPAEIFASDDSVSDAGVAVTEDLNILQDSVVSEQTISSKDKMFGGVNIKLEKPENLKSGKNIKKSKEDTNAGYVNLADIKIELQDDFDWSNMTLATVNNPNVNRIQTMYRRDNGQNRDEYSSQFGANSNKNDIDDHLDTMQTDLDSLRELLRSDSYALDTNTLLGLFGSDDPFYGLSCNSTEDRNKTGNTAKKLKGDILNASSEYSRAQSPLIEDYAEGNQLISYTGNIPDFADISIPDLETLDTQERLSPSPSSSALNTPQVQLDSPKYVVKP